MDTNKQKSFLLDNTKCIGCRACQVACKQWNNLLAEKTKFFGGPGYQNPANLSSSTFTLIRYHEVYKNGEMLGWVFAKHQCQHCISPACANACITGAMHKTEEGPVVWDEKKCIGCRYCMIACPYNIPKFEWSKVIADIRKCTFCQDRILEGLPPSCSKACPTGAILYGERGDLIKIAERRLKKNPEKYHQHIYGLTEVGGTCVLNISSIPLEDFNPGYPENLLKEAIGSKITSFMKSISPVAIGLGAALGITALIYNRKKEIAEMKNKDETLLNEKEEKNE
ncbi:4Fe-4S dicluster domain-containing protein [Bacteroidota bacterium]